MRGTTLVKLLDILRVECGLSLNPAHNPQNRDTQIATLQRVQETMWADFAWPHLRVERAIDVQAGQRYYDMPGDLDIDRIEKIEIREAGVTVTTTRVGAMFGLFFTDQKVETYAQATACDTAAFNRFFHAMLERGVFLAPSAYEAGFLSSAHDDAVIDATLAAAREAFKAIAA